MELRLQKFIDQLISIADVRNLSPNNPIKLNLAHPNTSVETIVVVSYEEPFGYPLPYNVTWINADSNSIFYKTALKRTSKNPSEGFNHSWQKLDNYMDVFEPEQYYDDQEDPDSTAELLENHIQAKDNPHDVTVEQIGAINKRGDSMEGPLILPNSPTLEKEATNKKYVDRIISDVTSFLGTLQSTVANNATQIQSNKTSINNNHTTILSNLAGIQQNIVKIQQNLNAIQINKDSVENNTVNIQNILSSINDINEFTSSLKNDIDNLIVVANMTGYVHVQNTDSSSWSIEHNKNSIYYNWNVWDQEGSPIIPDDVLTIDENNLKILFAAPITGKAILSFHRSV